MGHLYDGKLRGVKVQPEKVDSFLYGIQNDFTGGDDQSQKFLSAFLDLAQMPLLDTLFHVNYKPKEVCRVGTFPAILDLVFGQVDGKDLIPIFSTGGPGPISSDSFKTIISNVKKYVPEEFWERLGIPNT